MDIIVTLDVLSKLLSSNSFRVSNSATVIHSLFFPQGCFLAGVALSPNVVELMAVILLLALGPGWVGPHSTFASVGLLACWCQCCLTLLDPGSSESEETPTDLLLVSKGSFQKKKRRNIWKIPYVRGGGLGGGLFHMLSRKIFIAF